MPFSTKLRSVVTAVLILAAGWLCPEPADAGAVVICNRTAAKVDFSIVRPDGKARAYGLQPNDLVPIPVADEVGVAFRSEGATRRYLLHANTVHYFAVRKEKLDLVQIAFRSSPAGQEPRPNADQPSDSVCTIPVMLLVDDDEPAVRRIWEKRLRDRLAKASAIIEHHCRVRFDVVAVGTWVSDNTVLDFHKSLKEFELSVNPAPARLAIGFTSQYKFTKGRAHLGGTRGPLHSHIFIREWSQHISSTERLEVLLHELGHFLGAAHSPEPDSVMRATLGDRRSHARDFRIGFDAPNTLAMYLMGEELRTRRVRGLHQLRPQTKAELRGIYQGLAKVMPNDPSVKKYVELLDLPPYARPAPAEHPKSLVKATQVVVRAITEAAQQNRSAGPTGTLRRLSGDRLSEYYVRRAAAAASRLPRDRAAQAFLLGLGIGLDDSPTLRYAPILSHLCRQVESNQQRRERLAVLGSPTVAGRRDLAQHFFVACALAAVVGQRGAETAGIAKELSDSRGSRGFSFVDLSADLAGASFAAVVRDSKVPLKRLAASFAVKDFFPETYGLKEGISWQQFTDQFESAQDARFHRQTALIRQRILALPGYKDL